MKIKNWKLTLLGFIVIGLLASLGYWQLSRWEYKTNLLNQFKSRSTQPAVTNQTINQIADRQFYRAILTGKFDNDHNILLDNKTYKGRVGYEVYTPFHLIGSDQLLLVDRGFIPMGPSRQTLPPIPTIIGSTTIQGLLTLPPAFFALGDMIESTTISWPLRVEFIQLTHVSKLLNTPIYPYILRLAPDSPYTLSANTIDWNIFSVSPERHMAYAFQWFALALTLLVICIILNQRK